MVARKAWELKVAVLTLAALVAIGPWEARAQLDVLDPLDPAVELITKGPHFKCYVITPGTALNKPVFLLDQFHPAGEAVTIRAPHLLCTPVERKVSTDGISLSLALDDKQRQTHLKCYQITPSGPAVNATARVMDQFHREEVKVTVPLLLCAPAIKEVVKVPE